MLPAVVFACNAPAASVEPNLSVPLRVNEPLPAMKDVPTSSVDNVATEKLIELEMVPEFE